jgi:hypothetical protein
MVEREIDGVIVKYQFGFRRRKVTWDKSGVLKIISERTMNIHEEMCAFFGDWHKTFDRVNWT